MGIFVYIYGMNITTESFIAECVKTHKGFYTYENTVYITAKSNVVVNCPIHGEFKTIAHNHKKGSGCPKCGDVRTANAKCSSTEKFITKTKKVHGDTYDYSKVNYQNSVTNVEIICKEHGSFFQTPSNHLGKKGCPECGKINRGLKSRVTKEDFKERAKKVHGELYDYTNSDYQTSNKKVEIICKKHGSFFQSPFNHLTGSGCKKCSEETPKNYLEHDQFLEKAKEVHSNLYNYEGAEYTKSKDIVGIVCKKHGYFEQMANAHLSGKGCPKCSYSISRNESEIFEFLKDKGLKVEERNRSVILPQEIDILVADKKIAIEYNGLYFHSDKFLNSDYHLLKTESCESKGYQLIHIFSDEWISKKNIVKSRLLNLVGKTENKIYARKCDVKQVPTTEAMLFLDSNHIQGKLGSKIKLGLYYEDRLVSIMTFGGLRKSLGSNKKEGYFELLRFCNEKNTTVIGGASKLFKHFLRNFEVKNVISYADRRWSIGNLYEKLGFSLTSKTKPNYFYTKGHFRENRFKYRKSEIIINEEDKEKTEKEIMKERGYNRVYDSGALKYSFKNN